MKHLWWLGWVVWAVAVACGGPPALGTPEPPSTTPSPGPVTAYAIPTPTETPYPTPTATATPLVFPSGRQEHFLMANTPQETPAYLIGSGESGPVVLILGGVHGDEPGGWLAAERIVDFQPKLGTLLIVPRANRQATLAGRRTTPELGDLNRLYPGDPQGLPMSRMAAEIVALIEEYRVDVVLDLHESWGFYKDRLYSSTAFLGQTISASPHEKGASLAQTVAAAVNQRIADPQEEMIYREFPPRSASTIPGRADVPEAIPTVPRGGGSSLGLGQRFPNTAAILVEMGQMQPLERRVALHLLVVEKVLQALGML